MRHQTLKIQVAPMERFEGDDQPGLAAVAEKPEDDEQTSLSAVTQDPEEDNDDQLSIATAVQYVDPTTPAAQESTPVRKKKTIAHTLSWPLRFVAKPFRWMFGKRNKAVKQQKTKTKTEAEAGANIEETYDNSTPDERAFIRPVIIGEKWAAFCFNGTSETDQLTVDQFIAFIQRLVEEGRRRKMVIGMPAVMRVLPYSRQEMIDAIGRSKHDGLQFFFSCYPSSESDAHSTMEGAGQLYDIIVQGTMVNASKHSFSFVEGLPYQQLSAEEKKDLVGDVARGKHPQASVTDPKSVIVHCNKSLAISNIVQTMNEKMGGNNYTPPAIPSP